MRRVYVVAAAAYLILLGLSAVPAHAQQPAPERVIDITGSLEGAIDAQVQRFKQGGRPEVLRLSDVLLYPFGVYQPILTCTVLRACIIELQAGETLISLVALTETLLRGSPSRSFLRKGDAPAFPWIVKGYGVWVKVLWIEASPYPL